MSLELRTVNDSGAGRRRRFDQPVISLGRHPHCDFRFDPDHDLDVSARHAEIRETDGRYTIRDLGSRNGIFVNGTRVEQSPLVSGDVISFGQNGPKLEVDIGIRDSGFGIRETESDRAELPAPPAKPGSRISRVAPFALLLAVVAVVGYLLALRQARQREREMVALARQTDSLTALYNRNLSQMAGQLHQLDSALGATRAERDRLRAAAAASPATPSSVDLMAQMRMAEARRQEAVTTPAVDYSAIAEKNGSAVTLIAVEWHDGKSFTGSGFSVTREGLIVTNRHLVQREGQRPKRIMVIFSDTRLWVPARLARVAETADLALLQVEVAGPFPTVTGVSRTASNARVGSPVAIIGYPLGVDTPMEGSGVRITARSTLGAGILSKNLPDVVQIDAYAGDGSSGSPVFDGGGNVIAVVFGGAREAQNRIVYAVPTDQLMPMLPIESRALLR